MSSQPNLHVFDLHCDTLDVLGARNFPPFSTEEGCRVGDEGFTDLASNSASISLDRMAGFDWCQCFAVWVPDLCRLHDASIFYRHVRDFFYQQLELHADRVEQIRDARDIEDVIAHGKVAAMLTIENSTPIVRSINAIHELAEDGVKMVTLTWNARNPIGSGHETTDGLTTFGREAIRAFEDERIVVDVSHLNDPGFADLIDIVRRPFVASHSNARTVCNVPRNLTDYQFCAIRDMGGLVGLNFYHDFITTRAMADGEATIDELAAHVEHFLDLGGEDTLALGSDWDGSDVPSWLGTCDTIANLHRDFTARFGETITNKMFFTNARDFFVRNETA